MEIVARELIPRLVAAAPEARFTAFINREAEQAADGPWGELIPSVMVPVNARNRIQWVLGEQVLLPRLGGRHGIQLLHSLGNTAPGLGDFIRVVTVHDLIYKVIPAAHFGLRRAGVRILMPLSVRRAHRVIADSSSTREDLRRYLHVPAGKIDVVPLGVGSPLTVARGNENALRRSLGIGDRRVLLTLSAKRPHKNLMRLLEALSSIAPSERPVLLLPGYPTPHEGELKSSARTLDIETDVRFLGWTTAETLEALYALAAAFVYPSLYEGFGLPVLEAMARGVPVACSNATSLPEVAGDAALLFDPERVQDIAAAITRLLADDGLAERLRLAGRRRAAEFSWQRTAELTVDCYRRALSTPLLPAM
jgi:glycosyltransferase involved in cell wall biosynthesis